MTTACADRLRRRARGIVAPFAISQAGGEVAARRAAERDQRQWVSQPAMPLK
jgi:hypothetical protein